MSDSQKKNLSIVYGVGATLIIVGAVMSVFMGYAFGKPLMFTTLVITSFYQGNLIDKLSKQLKGKEQKENCESEVL